MIELTLKKIKKEINNTKNVGILATTGSIRVKIFDKIFKPQGYKIIVPENEIQIKYVMKGIYDIKQGIVPQKVKSQFLFACEHLIKNSAQIIIAACSEIPLAINKEDINIPFIDATEILAQEAVNFASN